MRTLLLSTRSESRGPACRRRLTSRLTLLVLPLTLLLAPGCYRRVSYTSPEGRQVELINLGFDTRIGALHAETPNGSLRLENVDSQALLAQRIAELAAALAAEGGR